MAKGNLILEKDWRKLFCELPDEDAGKLIKAAFSCHDGEAVTLDNPVLGAVFSMIKGKIIENDAKYQKKCEQNAKNRAGSETEKDERKQTLTAVNERQRTEGNKKENIKDKVKEKEKEVKEKEIRHRHGEYKHILLTEQQYSDLLAEYGDALTKAAIDKVDKYCEETGKRYKNYFLVIKRWGVEAKRPEIKKVQWFTAGGHRDDGTDEAKRKLIAMQTGRTV